jgi:hypothetical protein
MRALGQRMHAIVRCAADQSEWFATCLADLRVRHRRRPTLIAMLDKPGLADAPTERRTDLERRNHPKAFAGAAFGQADARV